MGIGRTIAQQRKLKGWNQEQLSKELKAKGGRARSRQWIANLERDRIRPSAAELMMIANALEVDLGTIHEIQNQSIDFDELERIYRDLEQEGDNPIRSLALDATATWAEMLRSLGPGKALAKIPVVDEIDNWRSFVNPVQRSVRATSFLKVAAWWDTPAGRLYLDANIRKAKTVEIRRLFLYYADPRRGQSEHDHGAELAQLAKVVNEQREAGIHIKVLPWARLDEGQLAEYCNQIWDIAIVDDDYMIKLPQSSNGELLSGSLVYRKSREVELARHAFDYVWDVAADAASLGEAVSANSANVSA